MRLRLALALLLAFTPPVWAGEPAGLFHQNLAFSPDGRLAYSALVDGRWRVFLADTDGANGKTLSPPDQDGVWVALSADGRWVGWSLDRDDGTSDLLVASAPDARNAHTLTYGKGRNTYPDFSPDGRRIAFSSDRDGGRLSIWTAAVDGSTSKLVAGGDGADALNPAWSPDGGSIVFCADRRDGHDQLEVVAADGSARRRLTDGKGHYTFPSFTPDGKSVLATRAAGRKRELVLVDVASGSVRVLPVSAGILTRLSPDGKRLATIAGNYGATRIELSDFPATTAGPTP